MVDRVEVAEVVLWGRTIGAVSWHDEAGASFEYTSEFRRSGIELAPLTMPLGAGIFRFPHLAFESYRGLPGLLADALPDRFGNRLIDQWVQRQGRTIESFSPVERLCYLGRRGMGALEFEPAHESGFGGSEDGHELQVDRLVELASAALSEKDSLVISIDDEDAFNDIIRVGTSAGGARAKAVIAWNETTGEVRSGQVRPADGFTNWLLKFDMASPTTATRSSPIRRATAKWSSPSRRCSSGGDHHVSDPAVTRERRSHFMTRRFDRVDDGAKLHMQTLFAIAHFDFNQAGAYSYEQALAVMRRLGLPHADMVEEVRRAAFNVMARNQDDHTKNIAFLMSRSGEWRLSPAYDITWAYNPSGQWTNQHQMTLNAKRDDFVRDDLVALAAEGGVSSRQTSTLLDDVAGAVAAWPSFAADVDIAPSTIDAIGASMRQLR